MGAASGTRGRPIVTGRPRFRVVEPFPGRTGDGDSPMDSDFAAQIGTAPVNGYHRVRARSTPFLGKKALFRLRAEHLMPG